MLVPDAEEVHRHRDSPIGFAAKGTPLEIEVEVEWERRRAPAVVVDRPFYDPPHRRA